MEDIKELLQMPDNMAEKDIQKKFENIANKLMKEFCLSCGEKKFYFAEIEFYYYDECHFNQSWNEVTYERNGYKAGDLFYHLSGMDICFDSQLSKNKGRKTGYGGGILIRSIVEDTKENEEITVGPLTCVNKMLNACRGGYMPQLESIPKRHGCVPKETYRYLGKDDFKAILEKKKNNKDGELKLAYYDSSLSQKNWDKARSSYYAKRLKYNTI